MSESETCTTELPEANRILFLEKVRQSNIACQNGDFAKAVQLYTDALILDPKNHILYSNRSAARLKQGQFLLALQDASKAREICPQWPKAYFRQGVALQCLGKYGEALAAFSSGLAQDPNSKQLLSGLIEASIKSPLHHALEPTFDQLKNMNLNQSPFVVISVIGQELLAEKNYESAVTVLESALRIGSCSLKLRGSVFSALSSAYWALNQLDKAISYMQQDLAVAKSLGDQFGECRAHGNLGAAYFSQGSFKEALTAHRYQLVLAMKCKNTLSASIALTSLGHVYTATGDYPNALNSHKQCAALSKQMGNLMQEAREIGNVGAVYMLMGEFDLAIDCHQQHLFLATKKLSNQIEAAKAYSNLGSCFHYKRDFNQAIVYHENVLKIATQINDKFLQARFNYRAYAGLGHAARCAGDYSQAKKWHEKQLEMALAARDKIGEGRACSNLGIVYQLLGEHDHALKLHQAHLQISKQIQDKAGMGRAYGNIGNAYSSAGLFEQAIKYHKQELIISKEVHDRSAEASTHGNLACCFQAIGAHGMALIHYRSHLNIARELKDSVGESCALLNLGNCLSSRQEFAEAVQYYEQYLMLSQEIGDVAAEGKACHFLGYAHYCLGNYREAVRYYDQDLALAKDLQNKVNMGRAYCNLGLAHLALGNHDQALECQKYFLAIAHMTQNNNGKFRALGNIGDVLIKIGDLDEAAKMFQRQLQIARQLRERGFEATACAALGGVNRLMKKYDKSLGFHTQELTLRQELSDISGECRAHMNLGAVHMAIGNFTHAVKCYQEQLERAQELKDMNQEAIAYANLGIVKLNMGHFEEAIGFCEQQLGALEQINSNQSLTDRAKCYGNLADCYRNISDNEEAIKFYEQYLQLSLQLPSLRDQERAYRGLGLSHKQLGNLQEALVCLEKRLFVAHELGSIESKAAAYGDLGNIHCAMSNYEQAVSCLEHQRDIARELDDRSMTSDAIASLGTVFLQMGDLDAALRLHKMDLELCESVGNNALQIARAYGNLASVYEVLKNFHEAVKCLEKQSSLSTDRFMKTTCFLNLGRILLSMNQTARSIDCLQSALQIAQSLNKSEEESKIRYALGLSLISSNENEEAKSQIENAAHVLDTIRLSDQRSSQSKSELYNLQTKCYQTLQQILMGLGKEEEALVAAEKCRSRSITDCLRNSPQMPMSNRKLLFSCGDYLFDTVDKIKTHVIYYSIANDELYAWYLEPQKKIVRFHMTHLNEEVLVLPPSIKSRSGPISGAKLLENYISYVRDSLGVYNGDDNASVHSVAAAGQWRSSSSDNLIDEFTNERQGFLRMVNRNHLLNSSNYSLSSLFSLGSISSLQGSTRSAGSFLCRSDYAGSTRSRTNTSSLSTTWQGPTCLHILYNLLLAPFEDLLPKSGSSPRLSRRELILVLEDSLYLVPFAILKSCDEDAEFFSERCSLLTVPSIQALRQKSRLKTRENCNENNINKALVVGVGGNRMNNPDITWSDPTSAVQEAALISEMLNTKPLLQQSATKEIIVNELTHSECIHFACQIAWKHSAVVLSPGNLVDSQQNSKRFYSTATDVDNEEDANDVSNGIEVPVNDYLLTGDEVSSTRLAAKLVVFNTNSTSDQISGDAVSNFTSKWLIAGTGAVLISLWPVPEMASKILLRAFYSALLQGSRVAIALTEAMQTVQHTKHFSNPVNWAGFIIVGGPNVRLSNKVALIGQALCELLKQPEKCRDALRVCLHLIEKSLQRIHRGQKNAMYTTQKSIENKAGCVNGWRELLMAVGFRFEPAANGIPSSVFFPQSDPEERLSQCSASLQSLLALTQSALHALSKLVTNNSESSDDIISVMRNIVTQFASKPLSLENEGIDISLNVRLWKIGGFHEMLASLGFDLMDVGQDQVTLRTGKQANKRSCQFVLQSLLALFTHEAPKTLGIDTSSETSSSTESLNETIDNDMAMRQNPNYKNLPRPHQPRVMTASSRSAFTSYQKKSNWNSLRGEPDGGHQDVVIQQKLQTTFENTDSELSDGYTTQKLLAKYSTKELCYGGIRGTTKISRPGGGGESDANFTPSPIDNNVTLALTHQTRIRHLYTNIKDANSNGIPNKTHRPDSSSSTSSAAEWDSAGHATVLRGTRGNQLGTLPIPSIRTLPLVPDNGRPSAPVYNNMMAQSLKKSSLGMIESTSSDSEGWIPSQTRNKIKLHQQYIQNAHQPNNQLRSHYQDVPSVSVSKLKEQFNYVDRLSVRTETSKCNANQQRKSITTKSNNDLSTSANSLYFSPAELQNVTTNLVDDESNHKGKDISHSTDAAKLSQSKSKIQDSIMRHMSREMSMSDVFHERNIGLISAPPLSKLLMTNYEDESSMITHPPNSSSPTSGLNKLMNAIDLSEEIATCTSSAASKILACVAGVSEATNNIDEELTADQPSSSNQIISKIGLKKKALNAAPWISSLITDNILKPSDLTTAEQILEHQKIKSTSSSSSNSDHLSVLIRDDADGHSQCSSTPKNNSLPSQPIRNNVF